MDHFTQIYWDKKKRDTTVQQKKDKEIQDFWVKYNQELNEQELQTKASRR